MGWCHSRSPEFRCEIREGRKAADPARRVRVIQWLNECSPTVGKRPYRAVVGPNVFGLCFKALEQTHLPPRRGEAAAVQPEVLVTAVVTQTLAGQPKTLGKQLGELTFATHAAAEAAVVILAAA